MVESTTKSSVIHAKKPRSNRVKPTQFQGQIDPLFGTDFYFMEIYRIAILISQCSVFFKEASMHVLLPQSVSSRSKFKSDLVFFSAHRILLSPLSQW